MPSYIAIMLNFFKSLARRHPDWPPQANQVVPSAPVLPTFKKMPSTSAYTLYPRSSTLAPRFKTPAPHSRAPTVVSTKQSPSKPPHPLELKALDAQIHHIFQQWLQHTQSFPNAPELGASELYKQMSSRIAILGAITYEFNWVISEFSKIHGAEHLLCRPVSPDPTAHLKIPVDDIETLCLMWSSCTNKFKKRFKETWGSPKQGAVLMKEELSRLLHLSLAMEKVHLRDLANKDPNKKTEREGAIARDADVIANREAASKVAKYLHQKLERTRYRILNSNYIEELCEGEDRWNYLASLEGKKLMNEDFQTGIMRTMRKEIDYHEAGKTSDDEYEELDINEMLYLQPFNCANGTCKFSPPHGYSPLSPIEQTIAPPPSPTSVKHTGSSIHTTSTSASTHGLAILRSFFSRSSTKSNASVAGSPPRKALEAAPMPSPTPLEPPTLAARTPRKLKKCVSTPALKVEKPRKASQGNRHQMVSNEHGNVQDLQCHGLETQYSPQQSEPIVSSRPSALIPATQLHLTAEEVGQSILDLSAMGYPLSNTSTCSFNRDWKFPMPPTTQHDMNASCSSQALRPKRPFFFAHGRKVREIAKGEEDEYLRKYAYHGDLI